MLNSAGQPPQRGDPQMPINGANPRFQVLAPLRQGAPEGQFALRVWMRDIILGRKVRTGNMVNARRATRFVKSHFVTECQRSSGPRFWPHALYPENNTSIILTSRVAHQLGSNGRQLPAHNLAGDKDGLFSPPTSSEPLRTDRQRQVLASSGYLELGTLDDTPIVLEEMR